MGFVRKITGAQAQANALRDQAKIQANALEASSRATAQAAAQNAASAARATSEAVAREAAQQKFADASAGPMDGVDVQLDDPAQAGSTRRRRAQFGVGSGSGVRI